MTEGRFLSEIRRDVLDLVRKRGDVSVAEVCRALPNDDDFILDRLVLSMVWSKQLEIQPAEKGETRYRLGPKAAEAMGDGEE